MGIRRGRKGLGPGRLGVREEGPEDPHLSHSSVPLACGRNVALDYDGPSGSKAPLQSPHVWHRLWEENMGVPSSLRSPTRSQVQRQVFRKGPLLFLGNASNSCPLPHPNKPTLFSLPAPNTRCPLYFLSSQGSLWIGAP